MPHHDPTYALTVPDAEHFAVPIRDAFGVVRYVLPLTRTGHVITVDPRHLYGLLASGRAVAADAPDSAKSAPYTLEPLAERVAHHHPPNYRATGQVD